MVPTMHDVRAVEVFLKEDRHRLTLDEKRAILARAHEKKIGGEVSDSDFDHIFAGRSVLSNAFRQYLKSSEFVHHLQQMIGGEFQ